MTLRFVARDHWPVLHAVRSLRAIETLCGQPWLRMPDEHGVHAAHGTTVCTGCFAHAGHLILSLIHI